MDVNDQGRCFCNVTAIVRITLADGSWHEDVGCGQSENIKSKGAALDKVGQQV
jgi:DNA repair and recombination protein RAD52